MIIRHAEKPDGTAPGLDATGNEDDSSLTAVGWERAHALVGLFDPAEGDPRPGLARPQTIYAAGVTDEGEGQRTRETVAPLADALGLPVNTEYGKGEEKKLMKDVLELSGTTLISWQHSEIPAIADAFESVTPAPAAGVAVRPLRRGLDVHADRRRLGLHPDPRTPAPAGPQRRHRRADGATENQRNPCPPW